MTDRAPMYSYDYVNQPYARVRTALLANPHYVFRHATAAAATHAATLHVHIAGIDVGKDVAIEVIGVENDRAYDQPATKLTLEWHALENKRMYPMMRATLVIFALSSTETQLELRGTYLPPLGKFGDMIDAVVGHRIAEASVTRFIQEVAGWLREELAKPVVDPNPLTQP